MLDPNTPISILSDDRLLIEFNEELNYKKFNLYAIMAKRADNLYVRKTLFKIIMDNESRMGKIAGRIMHSWLPAIFILREGSIETKHELKKVLYNWDLTEKRNFLDYLSSDKNSYDFLESIIR